ncbi:MAG: hypothetical protein FVQ79_14125 [Planctomycetes bacterium]|nr:hypothetical protein [Planctomycetota bacterium]
MSDILRFFNFAYSDFFTLVAFGSLFCLSILPEWGTFPGLSFGWGIVVAALLDVSANTMVMLLIDKLFFTRLRNLGVISLFISVASLGVAFIIRAFVNITWGPKV